MSRVNRETEREFLQTTLTDHRLIAPMVGNRDNIDYGIMAIVRHDGVQIKRA